ncbi:hypothetical protein pdam_00000430 [Pocillopora damicornis]|uniref:Uncharacterized protein n=1 Tax=Pocillopora damicornis TaxID=46731 RepID=A0A3M6UJS5_POCDA|nr:hypothetical protein pdam_00000430 [Pocillopora damicornis]
MGGPYQTYSYFMLWYLGHALKKSRTLLFIEFSDIVFHLLSENLLKKLQHIKFSAASFVTGHYVNPVKTLFKLG